MIKGIEIYNFKCFEKLSLKLSNLNVFSGLNGMGKSTLIQSILMLKQSHQQNYLPHSICLNGDYVNLGVAQDILYEHANQEEISITICERIENFNFKINYKKDADILGIQNIDVTNLEFFKEPFEYLNAERIAPQVIYPKSSFYIDSKSQLGINGQYTVHYLAKYQDEKVKWNCCDGVATSIKEATQYWLNEISPGVKLDVTEIENTDLAKLGFYYFDETRSRTYRPTNVGFGISYILPVIVALLKSETNTTLVIENPEAHLHPRGQRKMGELIALCAANGTQILLETHSDHILNGIRIAVKRGVVNSKQTKLFYFTKFTNNNKVMHIVEQPQIKNDGKLDYWPDGFFDEWEKALDEII